MKRWEWLLILALTGVASLALAPFELLVDATIDPIQVRLLSLIQPAIITVVLVGVGELTAKRIGLGTPVLNAWIAGGDWLREWRRQIGPAALVAVFVAALLVVFSQTIGQQLLVAGGEASRLASFEMPLISKLLYGGITEEVLTRWGLLSLFAWLLWRITGRKTPVSVAHLYAAAVFSAGLFAAGHLPLLFLISENPSASMVAIIIGGNFVPGMLFGALYIHRGLEAAILAHAGAHLLSTIYLAVSG